MKRPAVIALVVIVIVLVVGAVLVFGRNNNKSASSTASSSPAASSGSSASPASAASPASSAQASAAAVVTYSSSGFSPAQTTVKSGQSVTFENKTSEAIQVDSNPHPVHTDDTDLNVGTIGPGQSKTVTLTKKGAFGFHNHLDPTDTAKITIE